MAAALAGCGGDDGAKGDKGDKGDTGATGERGPAGQDATAKTLVAALSPEQWADSKFTAEITSISINDNDKDTIPGTPVVEFKVSDALGRPVVGLEANTAKSATATLTSYPNVAFALAKLVPATSLAPSKWVSYIVTTVPTKNATTGVVTPAAPTRPSTDNTGTLVGNGDGTYKYTFYRDITTIAADVAAMTVTNSNNDKAALGDLTFEKSLAHRLTIQIGGAARGTGSNTANGVTLTPAVNMANPINVVYNFTPETGQPIASADLKREVVAIESCNVCHEKLAFHGGGSRVDTDYCVVCHTAQFGFVGPKVKSTNFRFPELTETPATLSTTGPTRYSYTPSTNVADGEVAGNMPTMIHKIHQGGDLVKANYNFADVAFNNKGFSKLDGGQRMCSTCHDNTKAVNGDNWKNAPSALACGACHDGINFADDSGVTLADKAADLGASPQRPVGTTQSGHGRNGLAPTLPCSGCHEASTIAESHRTQNVTKNNPVIDDGLASFTYEIASATQATSGGDVTIKFRILKSVSPSPSKDETPVSFVAAGPKMRNPLAGFTGGPSFLLAYAMPNPDGSIPADYTNTGIKQAQAISISIAGLLNTSTDMTGTDRFNTTNVGSLSAQDGSGYYTATIKGVNAAGAAAVCGNVDAGTPLKCAFPEGAKMRAVGLQGYFTQITAPATAAPGIPRHEISVVKSVGTDAVRRTVVAAAKCSNCHEWFEGHGGNRVFETQICVMCHVPGLATSGRGIADATLMAYPFTFADKKILSDWKFDKTKTNAALNFPVVTNNFKDMIHGIHAGRDRLVPFQDARDRTPSAITLLDFRRMDFPGRLNNCDTCHVGSNAATTTYNTVAVNALVSTYESIDAPYAAAIAGGTATPALAKAALNTVNVTDTVRTPFAAACSSCHDAAAVKSHISLMGGSVNVARNATNPTGESCAICHGPGAEFDTAVVHK